MQQTAKHSVARVLLLLAVAMLILVPVGGPVAAAVPQSRMVWAAHDGIWTSDSVGGNRRHLVGTGSFDDEAYNPRWSHDGQWIAFMRRWAIWVVRADGSDAHVVPTRTRANLPQWSADDQRIYYFLEDQDPGLQWVSLDGSSSGSLAGGDPKDNSLVWSPDGRSGAISVASGGNYAVATTDASGGNRKVILSEAGTDFSPTAWSADGRTLLVEGASDTSTPLQKEFDVVVVNADGTGRRTLRRDAIADAWSPDGRWILFHNPPFGEEFLQLLRSDGSGEMMLPSVATGGADWGPGTVDPEPVIPITSTAPKATPPAATSAPVTNAPVAPKPASSSLTTVVRVPEGPTPGSQQSTAPPVPMGPTGETGSPPPSSMPASGRAAGGGATLLGDGVNEQLVSLDGRPSASRGPAVLASVALLALVATALALRTARGARQRAGST